MREITRRWISVQLLHREPETAGYIAPMKTRRALLVLALAAALPAAQAQTGKWPDKPVRDFSAILPVAHQAAGFYTFPKWMYRWQAILRRQLGDLVLLQGKEPVSRHDNGSGMLSGHQGECVLDLLWTPRFDSQDFYAALLRCALGTLEIHDMGRIVRIHQNDYTGSLPKINGGAITLHPFTIRTWFDPLFALILI
jgi:hypothetical protein